MDLAAIRTLPTAASAAAIQKLENLPLDGG